MSSICSVCGSKIRFIKIRIKDDFICGVCQDKLPLNVYSKKETYTAEEIKKIIEEGEARDNAKPDLFQSAVMKYKPKDESSRFDDVREYKKLLDEGLITEEEYERKKNELLKL